MYKALELIAQGLLFCTFVLRVRFARFASASSMATTCSRTAVLNENCDLGFSISPADWNLAKLDK
jgi:hypothetical protein